MSGNMDDLKDLLEAMTASGKKVSVGPGLSGFMGFSSTDEMKKYAEDMKELMTKDVEELAAQDGETNPTVIDVRGRKMVIPQSGPRRQNAVLFACLYAIENFAVDQILWSLGAKAHFVAKDGTVQLAPLVEKLVPKTEEEPAPGQKLGGRNILIGQAEEPQKTCFVALKHVATGAVCKVGIFVGPTDDGNVAVKLADGKTINVPREFAVFITDEKQLLEIVSQIPKASQ